MSERTLERSPDPLLMLNDRDVIVRVNDVCDRRLLPRCACVDVPLSDLLREGDHERMCTYLRFLRADPARSGNVIAAGLLVIGVGGLFPSYVDVEFAGVATEDGEVTLSARQTVCGRASGEDGNPAARLRTAMGVRKLEDVLDFVDNSPVGLQWISPTGHVLWSNRVTLELLGYTAEEMLGRHILTFSEDAPEVLASNLERLAGGGAMKDHHSVWRTKSGDPRHVLIDSSFNFDEDGNVKNSRCFIRDATADQISSARVQAERHAAEVNARHQDRFLRRTLHEFRTPCSILLQSLTEENDGDGTMAAQVRKIYRTLDDIRDAQVFESGKSLTLNRRRRDLRPDLRDRCEAAFREHCASTRPGTFAVEAGPNGVPAVADTDHGILLRAVDRLFDNALRYAADRTSAACVLRGTAAGARIEVLSDGPELNADTLFRACQRYYDSASDDSRFTASGIGLGLNMAFNLLSCLGSHLQYERRGEMNVFGFHLTPPGCVVTCVADADVPVKVDALPDRDQFLRWTDVELTEGARVHVIGAEEEIRSRRLASQSCPLGGEQAPRRPHILVVDDIPMCRRVLKVTLKKADCTCEEACDGLEAVAALRDLPERFDMCLMDCRMPRMDGIQAAVEIRKKLSVTAMPIIGFSADADANVRDSCMQAGMNDFMAKPATATMIRNMIDEYARKN